jgi:hypothetical protein
MKRFGFVFFTLFASVHAFAMAQGQEVAFFQDSAPDQPTPLTDTLDARLQALEAEAQELKPTLEDHTQRILKIEDGIKADKEKAAAAKAADAKKEKKWYEKLSIRGYTQVRINEVFEDDDSPAVASYVGDSSVGENHSFLLRRMRVILFGDINEHVYVYLQPDFAANVPGSPDLILYTQLRDAYADLYVDKDKEFRFRVGQSKIPYGWENMQSSQNRIPLDRNDALNSAARNERDLGVFFYYTPKEIQDLFKEINDTGLKGSGNYGMFALGAYNGQGGSIREQNDNLHVISRLTLPFYLDEQIVEMAIQGYIGKYSVLSSPISPLGVGPAIRPLGTIETDGRDGIHDKRLAWTFVYYPQPFGFQSEWTIGRGPSLNDAQTAVVDRSLYGGYAMVMYRYQCTGENKEIIPFARWNYYKGGYKSERNAPYSEIKEWEMGVEWQINKACELVSMYTITDRTNTTAFSTANTRSYQQFQGGLLRFQLQFNY